MRRAPRIDANQAEIRENLRALGCGVLSINGVVDLVVGYRGRNYLLEVKNPGRHWKSCDKRTVSKQDDLRATWPGQYAVVTSLEEALAVIGWELMMETNQIPVGSLVLDHEYYPRHSDDWTTVARYTDAMEAGEQFPPPYVVPQNGDYLVLDGWHRVQAAKAVMKRRGGDAEFSISCHVDTELPMARWLEVATEMNIKNGRPLSMQDRVMVANRLLCKRWSYKRIAQLLRMPMPKLRELCDQRIVDSDTVLKGAVARSSGTVNEDRSAANQGPIHSSSAYAAADNWIAFLRSGMVDASDPVMLAKLESIKKLMDEVMK